MLPASACSRAQHATDGAEGNIPELLFAANYKLQALAFMTLSTVAKHFQHDMSVPINLTPGLAPLAEAGRGGCLSSTEMTVTSSLRAASALEKVIAALSWKRSCIELHYLPSRAEGSESGGGGLQQQQQQQQQIGNACNDDDDEGRSDGTDSVGTGELVSTSALLEREDSKGGGPGAGKKEALSRIGKVPGKCAHRSPHRWVDLLQESEDEEEEEGQGDPDISPSLKQRPVAGSRPPPTAGQHELLATERPTLPSACAPSTPFVGVSLRLPSLSPFSLSPSPDVVFRGPTLRRSNSPEAAGEPLTQSSCPRELALPRLLKIDLERDDGELSAAQQHIIPKVVSGRCLEVSASDSGDCDHGVSESGGGSGGVEQAVEAEEEGATADTAAAAVGAELGGSGVDQVLKVGGVDEVENVSRNLCMDECEEEIAGQQAAEEKAQRELERGDRERQRQMEREKEKQRLKKMEEERRLLEKERREREEARKREQEWARQRAQDRTGEREHEKEIEIDMELESVHHLLSLLQEGYRPADPPIFPPEGTLSADGDQTHGAQGSPVEAVSSATQAGGVRDGCRKEWWLVGNEEEWWHGSGSSLLVSVNKAQTVAKVGLSCALICMRAFASHCFP